MRTGDRMKDRIQKVYEKAIDLWGMEAQTNMVVEEIAEFLKALMKMWRTHYNLNGKSVTYEERRKKLIEEMADVRIMLEQTQIMFHIDDWELVECQSKKFDRLAQKVESSSSPL